MGERIEVKLLHGEPGVVRATDAPSWEMGLKAAAAIIQRLTPAKELAVDSDTQATIAKWTHRPDEVSKPYACHITGDFAVQVRIIREGQK